VTQRYACDTSVAIAALDTTHPDHSWCVDLVRAREPALAGHAALETFSVLTRLPVPSRLTPSTAGRVILHNFPSDCPGPSESPHELVGSFARLGIAGGAVYDGLIALAAHHDERVLLTRDHRAERTYRRLGIAFELLTGPF
jgi:hypothetical protein